MGTLEKAFSQVNEPQDNTNSAIAPPSYPVVRTGQDQQSRHYDVVIIGAGPVGLFAVFELGLLGLRAAVVDVLDRPGGQCTELYADKPIYDIPAYPRIDGQVLIDQLMEQIRPFDPVFYLESLANSLECIEESEGDVAGSQRWRIATDRGDVLTCSAIFVAAGTGTFTPRRPRIAGIEPFEGTSLLYAVRDRSVFVDKHVLIAGGGDSALDWTLELLHEVRSMTLIHRRDRFRAAPASVERMRAAVEDGRMNLVIGDVTSLRGNNGDIESVEVSTPEGQTVLHVEKMLALYGLQIQLGPVADWGLQLHEDRQIVVDTEKFESSRPGIFAIGDINWYPGKLKLILSGFHEAALASHAAFRLARPEEKLRFQYTTSSSELQQRLGASVRATP